MSWAMQLFIMGAPEGMMKQKEDREAYQARMIGKPVKTESWNMIRIGGEVCHQPIDTVEEKFGEQNFRVLTLALGAGALVKTIL